MAHLNRRPPTLLHCYSITLLVQLPAHLLQVAMALNVVLYRTALHEQGVLGLLRPLDPDVVVAGIVFGITRHVVVNLLVVGINLCSGLQSPTLEKKGALSSGVTLKNFIVAPPPLAPYLIPNFSDLSASSFTLLKWVSAFSVVKNAARFAV